MSIDISMFGDEPFVDGEFYIANDGTRYVYKDGCFLIPSPVDIDTVDGYAEQGVSDGTAVDAEGNTIAVGAPIINFYDSGGRLISSKDCTDSDTFSIKYTASASGTDDAGNAYNAGDALIQLADGSVFCQEKTIDTFSELIVASAPGIDDAGNAYNSGDALIHLPDGRIVSAVKTIDTDTVDGYAVQGLSDGTQLDRLGNTIPAGAEIISFYDSSGDLISNKDCTDAFGVVIQSSSQFTDTAGNVVESGQFYTRFPGGETVSAHNNVDTDTDTVDGYSILELSDGSKVDRLGDTISAGAEIITFYDASGAELYSKDCTDDDTFGVPVHAAASGVDVYGNLFDAGDKVIEFPGGLFVQLPDPSDEVGADIIVGADVSTWPTSPKKPHDVQFLCDSDNNLVGVVTASGVKPIIKPCQCPSISLVKSALLGPYEPGDTVTYYFHVINTGQVRLNNVQINDPKIDVIGGPIATLAAGQSDRAAFSGVYTYTQSDYDNGGCINVATVTAVSDNGVVVADVDDAEIFNEAPPENPSISLVKTATDQGPFEAGDTVDYVFVVTNTGDVVLSDVTVYDVLIDVSGLPVSLNPGKADTTTFTGSYLVTEADVPNPIVNNASVSGVSPAGSVVTALDEETVQTQETPQNPAITLAKTITSGAGPYEEGDTIYYAFEVENTGDVDLSGVQLSDPLLTVQGGPVSLAVGATDSNTFTGSYVVTSADVGAGSVDNTASVEGASPRGELVYDEDTVSATTESSLIKKCGTLAERSAIVTLASTSNPQLSANGNTYNMDAVAEFRTTGGVLLSTIEQTVQLVSGGILKEHSQTINPGTADALILYNRDGSDRLGMIIQDPGSSESPTSSYGLTNEFNMSWVVTDEIGEGMAVEGCEGSARTEISLRDVDNQSVTSSLSRQPDEITTPLGTNGGVPSIPIPDPFTWPTQANAYLQWNKALDEQDSVSVNYFQHSTDGLLSWAHVYYVPAVCYYEDTDGNIVSAETIDGAMDAADFGSIVPA